MNADYVHEDLTAPVEAELRVEGTLPPELSGIFLAVGGTGTKVGDRRVHNFDAHGRVSAVRISGGEARLRARMVNTPLYESERREGRMLKRRIFTNKPSRWSNLGDLQLGNNAWHNVVPWGDAVVVANEPGYFVLDPETLETRGLAPFLPAKGANMLPMPRRDPRTGHHVVVEVRGGPKDTIIVREIDDARQVRSEQRYRLSRGMGLYHDVSFTERYFIVAQWGAVDVLAALWGARPLGETIRFDRASTATFHLLPRAGGAPISIPVPEGRQHFHFWNAWDDGERVILDSAGYEEGVRFAFLNPPEVRAARGIGGPKTRPAGSLRYTLDPAGTGRAEALDTIPAEAPAINPSHRGRPSRYGWSPAPGTAGSEPDPLAYLWHHALARHDFATRSVALWDAGPAAYVSAPAFAPKPGAEAEDAGWIVAWVQEPAAKRAWVGVFDAADVAKGPIARLAHDGPIGMISHTSFGS